MATQSKALRNSFLSGTALILLSSTLAYAQDNNSNIISLDPIEVRKEDPRGDAADRATAVYVADAELEQARMGDLRDVFSGIASVSVGGALPVAQKIFVNGVDMLNLTISMDGVLQNNRVFHHVSANAFDPGVLKFVRVDPGVAAADTGPNAVAGAVVMETVDAADILQEGDDFGGNVRLSYGDNGNTFSRSVTFAGRTGGFEYLAYGKIATGDDFEDGGGSTIEGSAADLKSGLLKLAYEAAEGHRFEISGSQINDDALRPYRANIGEIIGGRPVSKTRVYDTQRSNYVFRYENTLADGMWDPEVVFGYSETGVAVLEPYGSEGVTGTYSGKLQNTFNLSSVDTIVAGLDYYDRKSEYHDYTEGPYEEKSQNAGLFVQGRFEPAEDWKLSGGLRYDWQDFTGVNGSQESFSGASANASASYNITDDFAVRAGYSNVFGGVQIEDNYEFWRGWSYDDLEPSRAQNYNLGFDWIQSNLTLGGEIFLTQIDDVRNGDDTIDFESQGFNVGATYDWTSGFMRLTYSNSNIKVDGSASGSYEALDLGAPIGQVVALQVQHSLPQYNMLVGGSIDIALDYDDTEATSDLALDGYEVVSAFAEYYPERWEGVTIRASVDNIFDQKYADRATYGADYADVVPLNEPGRTFVLEAVARF